MKLSIIIPVYNGEKYIRPCLDSIFSQILPECEIIIINDGSTDGTQDIIEAEYTQYLSTGVLKLIQQDNGGVSAARNRGIDAAQGEYIGFIDCDDIIADDYFLKVLDAIKDIFPDIIEFGFKLFVEGDDITHNRSRFVYNHFGQIQRKDVEQEIYSASIWYPFIRIVRTDILNRSNLRFIEGVAFCEDLIFFSSLYEEILTINHLNSALYYYRINSSGATFNIRPEYTERLITFYKSIINRAGIPMILLKVNVFYCLFNLVRMSNQTVRVIDKDVMADIKRNRFSALKLGKSLSMKRLLIYLVPNLMLYWYKIKKDNKPGLSKVER